MHETIINATGKDTIVLWKFANGKLYRKKHPYRTWIFASGSEYDLDFLANQLDDIQWASHERTCLNDVYGSLQGLKINADPSVTTDLVNAIEKAGMGRKFRIFNADINPVLRFMSENGLRFFDLESPEDMDIEIPVVKIAGRIKGNELSGIEFDGNYYKKIDADLLGDIHDAILNSIIVVYGNERNSFKEILIRMSDHGFYLPGIKTLPGTTYESYGQTLYKNGTVKIMGKICIPQDSFIYSESGLPGLCEISRTSSLPIVSAAIVTPGTAVSSMEESKAIARGILIPLYKDDHEKEKTLSEMMVTDRGGLTLQPYPGIYEDVYEIDFSSMYPSIIVNYNLSPETLSSAGNYKVPDTPYYVDDKRPGFLSYALRGLLEKRLYYKSIRDRNDVYRARDAALKWMLLTSFGYTGYKNAKFGKIEVHESITSIGRHVLSQAMKLSEKHGFSVLHGIVDSLWIKGKGDVDSLLSEINERTRVGIVMDSHYRWLAFLPARSGLGALNRYVGMRYDGTYKIRGIEIRRRDSPWISKKFQIEALKILEKCANADELSSKKDEIRELEEMYLENMWSFNREDFKITIHPTRHQEEYTVENIQKIAMRKSSLKGYELSPGEKLSILVVDKEHNILDIDGSYGSIDKKFYKRLLIRAFEPIDYIVGEKTPRRMNGNITQYG